MAIVDIDELFRRAESFEHRVERCYACIRDETENNGVRLLTYYLARHRRHLEEVLSDFDDAVVARVRAVKLKYDIVFPPDRVFPLFEADPKAVGSSALLDAAAEYDEALIGLYRSILKQPIGEEASLVFENLVKVEERDVVMIKKMAATNYF